MPGSLSSSDALDVCEVAGALLWLAEVEDDVLDDVEELVELDVGVAVPPDATELVDVEDPADPEDDVDPPEVTVLEEEVEPVLEDDVDPADVVDPEEDVDPEDVAPPDDVVELEEDVEPEDFVDPEEDVLDDEELEWEELYDDDNVAYGFVISETMLRPDMTFAP